MNTGGRRAAGGGRRVAGDGYSPHPIHILGAQFCGFDARKVGLGTIPGVL